MLVKFAISVGFSLAVTTAYCQPQIKAAPVVGQGLEKISAYHLKLSTGAALLVLGTTHTNDPNNRQVAEVEGQFEAFEPDEVLVEGGKWPIASTKTEAVQRFGEMGLAYFLANKKSIRVGDADPEFASEIEYVASIHGAEFAKLFYVLRMLRQFREESDPTPFDAKVGRWLKYPVFDSVSSMKGLIQNIPELEAAARKFVPNMENWRDAKMGLADTKVNLSQFNDITKTSSDFRDKYLTEKLVDRLLIGRRILVVVGYAHMDAQRTAVLPALFAK